MAPALAAEMDYPVLLGTSDTVLQHLRVVDSEAPSRKVDATFAVEKLRAGLFLAPGFSVLTELDFEPLRAPLRLPHRTHVFSDEGLYLGQLYAKAETDGALAYAGKFNPAVSYAADAAPGVFGGDYANDYQPHEMIGLGGALRAATPDIGTQALGVATFFADSTALGNAAFTQPRFGQVDTARSGRLHRSDGGVANTASLESILLTLDGDATRLSLPALGYHLAWARLRRGVTERKDQQDFVAALHYSVDLGDDVSLTPLVEAARVVHNGGSTVSAFTSTPATQRASYVTNGAELAWRGWSLSAVRSSRDFVEPAAGTGPNGRSSYERLLTASLGYSFAWGLSAAVGWKHDHGFDRLSSLNATSDTLGLQVAFHQDF